MNKLLVKKYTEKHGKNIRDYLGLPGNPTGWVAEISSMGRASSPEESWK